MQLRYKTKCYGKQDLEQNHGLNKSFRGVNTMAIGRKSRVVELSIHDNENPKSPYKVQVQANKHHGICDIILCKEFTKKVTHEFTGPDGKKRTKKKLKSFYKPVRRLSELVSEFQGRQYDDNDVMEHLSNVLTQILNPRKD